MTKREIDEAKWDLRKVGRRVTGTVVFKGLRGISTDGDGLRQVFGNNIIFFRKEEVESHVKEMEAIFSIRRM